MRADQLEPIDPVGQEVAEEVDQRPVGPDHDLVADGLLVRAGVIDLPGLLPGLAGIGRTREIGRAHEEYLRWRLWLATALRS